jgi:ABC-type nitrate/sulfonate/bicarbonate transport system ATPase subunit
MLLQCRDISFKYPKTEHYVFEHLSFEIPEPGFHALFGPSGVGKTSLARIITGEMRADDGRVVTEGMAHPLYSHNLERIPGWSSVSAHLDSITPDDSTADREALIRLFGLRDCLQRRFRELSLGQRNRVNLLRYLLQDFHLLIMDESLANVDERTREKILLNLKAIFPDRLFLYISHNVVEVSTFCRRILVLRPVHKSPQIVTVRGQDRVLDRPLDRALLEQTLLETMNAA